MKKLRELLSPKVVMLGMGIVAVLGLFMLGHKNFSMDELDTVFTIKDWPTLTQIIWQREANMWLYYTLLFGWSVLGHSEFVVRLFSVVFAVATIPVAYALAKTLFGAGTARIATLLLAVNTFLIFNAQNARGYALLLFLTTLASYLFVKYALEGSKKYLWLAVGLNVLAVYTHFYALFVIAAQFLALFWLPQSKLSQRRLWTQALPAYVVSGLLVLPLFLAPAFHAQPVSWIPVPGIRNLIGTFIILSGDFWPVAGIYGALLGAWLVSVWRKRPKFARSEAAFKWGLAGIWLVFPVVASFVFSLVAKPLYISAYFFVCLVPFTLLVSVMLASLRRAWLRRAVVGVIVVLSLVRLAGWYAGSHALELVIPNNTEDWGKTAAYVSAQATPADAVLFFPSMELDKVNYYAAKRGVAISAQEVELQPYFLTTGQLSSTYDNAKLEQLPAHHRRVWLVLERVTGKDTDAEMAVIEQYLRSHYSLKHVERFEFLEVQQFER